MARELGLVPSTCLHILRALAAEDVVTCDETTRRYSLDTGLLTLARSFLRRSRFAGVVQPFLNELARRHGVTAIGVEVRGLDRMIAVAIAEADLPVRIQVDVGSRFPALISATGRCLAAFGDHRPSEVPRIFQGLRWDRAPSFARWQREVRATRENGYGIDRGDYIRGVTILAVPVLDEQGHMARSIAAVAVSEQLDATRIGLVVSDLRRSADAVSHGAGERRREGGR